MKKSGAVSVHYKFTQHFDYSPRRAYDWCTNYGKDDLSLMGEEGTRKIERINEDTLVLTDFGNTAKKKRLVRLYPERLCWVNTRLSEDGKHSQFIYEILPDRDKSSKLLFTGNQVFHNTRRKSPAEIQKIRARLVKEDSGAWRNLAKAMKIDLG